MCSTKLENFDSVEKYINTIITTAYKLNGLKCKLPDELVGAFLLSGLPDEYKPMIMGFESSGQEITADSVKNKLLQEVKWGEQEEACNNTPSYYTVNKSRRNFRGNYRGNSNYNRGYGRGRRNFSNNRRRCYRCNKMGHIESECRANMCNTDNIENIDDRNSFRDFNNRSEQNEEEVISFAHLSLISLENSSGDSWVIDSGASRHMSNIQSKFKNVRNSNTKYITVANKNKTSVVGEGQVV